jgi:2-polyprenyl-6-methoxyphenol hydroxylase-like FAD-dependent oxidoreductase
MEQADVVIVGGRLAGCAIASPLARAGKKVIVIDRMTFPSDQLSTHLLMPAGTSEFAKMGALPRIMGVNPTQVRWLDVTAEGVHCLERLRPADNGVDFGVCIPRNLQDVCLVEAARDQGADIREKCTFESLRWRAGRVAGINYRDADGELHEVEATLTVGADGRRSNVAAAVGAWNPYRVSRNGRGLVFRYVDDPQVGTREAETYFQWREGNSFAFAFPSAPVGKLLILFMGHRDEASEARKDPEGHWVAKVASHPGLTHRLRGIDEGTYTKIRSTGDCPAFFRASSGPGWALAGDAGHFKDPVTGQGMRDAMWMGRTLAEHVQPVLDDPPAVDRATRQWEANRDRHCLPAYHFANMDTRVERQSPTLCELVRDAGRSNAPDIGDLFGRARTLQEIAPLPRLAKNTLAALVRGERSRKETVVTAVDEVRTQLEIRRERYAGAFRPQRLVWGSDHPGAIWPDPPTAVRARVKSSDAAVASTPTPQEVPA